MMRMDLIIDGTHILASPAFLSVPSGRKEVPNFSIPKICVKIYKQTSSTVVEVDTNGAVTRERCRDRTVWCGPSQRRPAKCSAC